MHQPIDPRDVAYHCSLIILKKLRVSRQPIQPGETEWLEKILLPYADRIDMPELKAMVGAVVGILEASASSGADSVAVKLKVLVPVYTSLLDLLGAIVANLPRDISPNGCVAVVRAAMVECRAELERATGTVGMIH